MTAAERERSEAEWDRQLKIRTTGRDDSRADAYRYPYEPTPYIVLERLAASGLIRKSNVLMDYGCGKGRVAFFMSRQTRCRSIGIDYDERMIEACTQNRDSAVSGQRTEFVCADATVRPLPAEVDRCFFFNPFSEEILRKTLKRLRESLDETPRSMLLFFYYPSDEYVSCLMTSDALTFYDEIDCSDLFDGNDPRERILIFEA